LQRQYAGSVDCALSTECGNTIRLLPAALVPSVQQDSGAVGY
jgi:hypothetical protein